MKTGLVIDAAVDLPQAFIRDHDIHVLPIELRVGNEFIIDRRDPVATERFLAGSDDKRAEGYAESFPPSAEDIAQTFLDDWVTECDHLLCITTTKGRSKIFMNATKAALQCARPAKDKRARAGMSAKWGASVINSRALFAGPGITVYEATRLIGTQMPIEAIESRLREVADCTHAFLIPDDLYYVVKRASKKGENSVNWAAYAVGSMLHIKPILYGYRDETRPVGKARGFRKGVQTVFDHAMDQIERGTFEVPLINISYGGPLARCAQLPGFKALVTKARQHQVEVLLSHLSMTAAINVGANGMALAFASRDFTA